MIGKVLGMRHCMSCVLFAFLVIILCSALTVSAAENPPQGAEELKPSRVHPVPASSLWIVVNLFTGQTSKQAVIVKNILERLGAEGQGIVLPYRDVTVENMIRLRPAFLALSPNGIPWCRYKGRNGEDLRRFFQSLRIIVEDMQIPVVGICGGHQALALAFGGKVGPIRGSENDCFPYGHNPTERGRHTVDVTRADPLFLGMGRSLNLVENHYDEVKRLPSGFVCLAANKMCPYQIIRHPNRPAYGVQAHCEYYLQSKPDGGMLLRNFLHIARTHNRLVRAADARATANRSITRRSPSRPGKAFW